jgi:hypothetical protein
MKNVTIAIDDETHRAARIRAAELGTSISALVKDYLQGLCDAPAPSGLREMRMSFTAQKPVKAVIPAKVGPPWLVEGQWVYTKDGKPRKPGAWSGKIAMTEDFDEWPQDVLASFEAWPYDDPDFKPMPFDETQFPPE